MPMGIQNPNRDLPLILALLMLLLFASPIKDWWTAAGLPWYLPYALWLLVIVLAAWSHWRSHRHEP